MLRFLLSAAVGLILSVNASADEPKATAVNLEELKYEITAAEKRGENVGMIAEAVAALEKALAKSAIKPGEAPPELTALRETVEAAAKKGENVEAISKELGLIEKALTGREYERPKPPEVKPQPVPPFRGGRGGIVIAGGNGFNTTSITNTNGQFTIQARQGDTSYTITGQVGDTTGPKIVIQTGDKKIEADDVKKVPDEHKAQVEKLLKMVNR